MQEEMTVVSFRVPKRLKKNMHKVSANWSKEVRYFIEQSVKKHKKKQILEEIKASMKDMPTLPSGTAAKLVREDRDSN